MYFSTCPPHVQTQWSTAIVCTTSRCTLRFSGSKWSCHVERINQSYARTPLPTASLMSYYPSANQLRATVALCLPVRMLHCRTGGNIFVRITNTLPCSQRKPQPNDMPSLRGSLAALKPSGNSPCNAPFITQSRPSPCERLQGAAGRPADLANSVE
jgi:hypothetical protein